ncbi:Sec7 domain-containing protein, partial [Cladochytrium replicatum]
ERKLLYRGPGWQVITSSTVKDRYLFLFSDVLVITKELAASTAIPELCTADETVTYPESLYYPKTVVELSGVHDLFLKEERANNVFEDPNPHPIVNAAVKKFATSPIKSVAYLIAKRILPCTAEAIAQFLHLTPGLSRKQVGRLLGIAEHRDILDAYLDLFQFRGQRIDESLPGAIDAILEAFARRWHKSNADLVAFDAKLVHVLVYSIMCLNAETHRTIKGDLGYVDGERALLGAPGMSAYQRLDVPDEMLREIYQSVAIEKLEMGMDLKPEDVSGLKHITVEVEKDPDSRLTLNVVSQLITLRIPAPDPGLRIVVTGRDLQVSPAARLDFSATSVHRFRVRGTQLGRKLLMMSKLGVSARGYVFVTGSVEPQRIIIEPAFLRHTFQLTF